MVNLGVLASANLKLVRGPEKLKSKPDMTGKFRNCWIEKTLIFVRLKPATHVKGPQCNEKALSRSER